MKGERQSGRAFPVALVLGGIVTVQFGAAVATTLFDEVGPAGAVLLRTLLAAVILVAIWRPSLRGHSPAALRATFLFGISLAGMNLCFYEALDRLPLGIAVTLEFVGPLGVAVLSTRRRIDFLWVLLAAAGIVLLSGGLGGAGIDGAGAALALVAGIFWGAYILIGGALGRIFEGGTGLALAMAIATVLVAPFGIGEGGGELLDPRLLALAVGVAILSSVIPYSFEFEALRRLPAGVFGVLMSLEPAVAATIGLVALGQDLAAREIVAIALVVTASAGALRTSTGPPPLEQ
jgi:inner membrane transporter RhtA